MKLTRYARCLLSLVMVAVVLLPVVSCTGVGGSSNDKKTVAVCNGYDIPYEELRFIAAFYKDYLKDIYGETIWDNAETAEKYRGELETLVMENLNQNYVVLSACRQLGIDTDNSTIDNYVNEQIALLKDELGSKKAYKEFLAEERMTDRFFRFSLSINFLESAIHYTLLDSDMYPYRIDENAAEYKEYVKSSGEYVRILHVYIENKEGEDAAANLLRAQEISNELRSISDVAERRRRLGEYIGSAENDDFMTVTGDGYYFTKGEMDEIYEEAAFKLNIGDVSEPVVCSGGNFIMMRLEPDEEYIANNVTTLLNSYHMVCLNNYIQQFRPDCAVALTDYGKTLDFLNLD